MLDVGVTLGSLIGLITGAILVFVLRFRKDVKYLFSIPSTWALGFIGDGVLEKFIDFEEIIASYFTFVLIGFGVVVIYPLARFVLKAAKEM